MNTNRRTTHSRSNHQAPTPPPTLWLPDHPTPLPAQRHAPDPEAAPPSAVLPAWVIDRIRTEFTRPHQAEHLPLPLLRLAIPDNRPGMDARTRCTTDGPGAVCSRRAVVLAELHPDALPARWAAPHPEAAECDDWPGFFHRTHRLLNRGGFLLIAARQQRIAGRLTDPLGALIAHARTAGFVYLQHIVVVHGQPVGDCLEPAPEPGMPSGLLHSDLLAFHRLTH